MAASLASGGAAGVPRGLRRFAKLLFAATFLLIGAGGLVTSEGAGLSVPDWPTSYGYGMFTFPPSKWVGNIKFEHVHRLIASAVGLLTVVFFVWVLARERRRWMKVLGGVALAAVIAQGVLGGLTVRYLLPTPVSVAHACLAQTFFCLTLCLAIFTSLRWSAGERAVAPLRPAAGLRWPAAAAFSAVFVQLILGAWMRHSGAGLAIPDYPLSFGRLLPDRWDARVAINFAHRTWALAVLAAVLVSAVLALRARREALIRRPAAAMLVLVVLQIALGALSIWTRKAVVVTVAHVCVGALLLASCAALAAGSWRGAWLEEPEAVSAEEAAR